MVIGEKNLDEIMRETQEQLKIRIRHVTTSLYHPQSNLKVERFHKTLTDILAKLTENDRDVYELNIMVSLFKEQ